MRLEDSRIIVASDHRCAHVFYWTGSKWSQERTDAAILPTREAEILATGLMEARCAVLLPSLAIEDITTYGLDWKPGTERTYQVRYREVNRTHEVQKAG